MTTALPAAAGVVLQPSSLIPTLLSQHPGLITFLRTRTLPPYFLSNVFSLMALLVYETVLATLAGAHIAPREALHCALEEKWRILFRAKDSQAITTIQDALQCCGFRSSRDMAFPFPDAHHGANACEQRYDRHFGCLGALIDQERFVSGRILAVVAGVFSWTVSLKCIAVIMLNANLRLGRRCHDKINVHHPERKESRYYVCRWRPRRWRSRWGDRV